MRDTPLSILWAAVALFTAPIPAQYVRDYAVATSIIELPPSAPGGSSTHTVDGDLTLDLLPDVVVQKGSGLVLLYNPGAYKCPMRIPVPGTANGMAMLPGDQWADWGRLAVVGSNRITLVQYDASQPAGQHWLMTTLGAAEWTDAVRICAADVDGDGDQDLVGVLADQRGVRVLLREAAQVFVPAANSFSLTSNVLDVIGVQLDATPATELAFLCQGGLTVRRADGTEILSVPAGPATTTAICRYPRFAAPDQIALLAMDPILPMQWLHLVGDTGVQYSTNMMTLRGIGLRAAVWNDAGVHCDLLVSRDNGVGVRLQPHQDDPDAPFTRPSGFLVYLDPPAPVPTTNSARAVWADLDLDHFPDVVMPMDQVGDVRIYSSKHEARRGPVQNMPGDITHGVFKAVVYVEGTPTTPGTITLLLSDFASDLGQTYAPELTLEADLYQQADPSSEVDPVAVTRVTRAAPDATPPSTPDVGAAYGITLQLLAQAPDSPRIYYVALRMTRAWGPTTTMATSAVQVAGFCVREFGNGAETPSWQYLIDNSGSWGPVPVYPGPRPNDLLGGLIPLPAVPLVDPDGQIGH